ncbi:uncharacterized protein METZ01_LOCUS31907 [marine metagenome]|uniref:Uncharacterized protein n=1 Tax=marine metagenome TaxID=408172 RepID=A0A381QND0_9ZZZZ
MRNGDREVVPVESQIGPNLSPKMQSSEVAIKAV